MKLRDDKINITVLFKTFYVVVALVICSKTDLIAQSLDSIVDNGYLVSSEGAWCWFADPRAIRHENKEKQIDHSYIGYIDVHGNIKAMQYDFIRKEQTEILVRSYFQPDDHNNPTFLILPDDRVMVFYSRHTDEKCFYYRVTKIAGDLRTLGKEKKILTDHNTTYPSPFILSGDSEHIYLCWRGINWHPTIAKLTLPDSDENVHFSWGPYQMVQSTGARPYAKYLSNGKDKIYFAYTTGHPDNEIPNYLYFNFFDIKSGQLKDIKGTVLSQVDKGVFHVDVTDGYVKKFPTTVIDSSGDRDWIWQVAQDESGIPRVGYVRISADKKSHDYYYSFWTGSSWHNTFLANGGSHFHQTPDLELCYSAGLAIDPLHPKLVYCSLPKIGKNGKIYEIFKFGLNETGDIVSKDQITRNSPKNNVRPYVITGSVSKKSNLLWMAGDYFDWIVSKDRPGYPTSIRSDFALPLDTNITKESIRSRKVDEGFSVSAHIHIDSLRDNSVLLRTKLFNYSINSLNLIPILKFGKIEYPSTNRLATSDSWIKSVRGTDGKWQKPLLIKDLRFTLTYSNHICRIYLNGLLDQTIFLDESLFMKFLGKITSEYKLSSVKSCNYELTWSEIQNL